MGCLECPVVVDLAVVDDGMLLLPHQRLLAVQWVHDGQPHVSQPKARSPVIVYGKVDTECQRKNAHMHPRLPMHALRG